MSAPATQEIHMGVMINPPRRLEQITVRVIAVGAIIVSAVGTVCVYYHEVGDVQPEVPSSKEARSETPQSLVFASDMPTYTPAPKATRLKLASSPPRAPESKALEFEMSALSQLPRVRFKAYELAHDCAFAHVLAESARTNSWLQGRPPEPFDASACGDLKPGQWDAQRRHELLREASLAGVHGAWFRVWQEGPNGPLRTIPDGSEYRAWEAQAREAALATGDPFVYAQEAQDWHAKDPQRALVATVIYREMLARRLPGMAFDPTIDTEIMESASKLDKAAAEQAIATGRAFVANAIGP
jgi:hypothetical protein